MKRRKLNRFKTQQELLLDSVDRVERNPRRRPSGRLAQARTHTLRTLLHRAVVEGDHEAISGLKRLTHNRDSYVAAMVVYREIRRREALGRPAPYKRRDYPYDSPTSVHTANGGLPSLGKDKRG